MDDRPTTLAGRYELGEVIGRGGMGTVYRATDLVLGRPVAVKVLLGQLADSDPLNVERFAREARAAAGLSHRGVVAVYDAGVDAMTRYIVMELVDGQSLEAILREQGRLDPDRAAEIVAQVADALAAAHAAGLVHRDIKPANVMVADDGSVKVLDFGIARAMDSPTLTQASAVLGTAAYMSPEQALGQRVDERSDIYSLGCVLYALLAGHPPFRGDSAAAILGQHANLEPPALADVPPKLHAVVLSMLSKAPGDRPQSAAAVRDRLRRPPVAPALAVGAATAATLPMPPAPTSRSGAARTDRRHVLIAGLLALVLVVTVIVALASGGGATRTGTRAKHHATTAARHRTTPRTHRRVTHHAPLTVSGAAAALTALVTRDAGSGTIDQQAAQQITGAMSDLLNSYQQGNAPDVQHKLADLSQHLSMLEQHGDIQAAAAPGLRQAVANLATAMAANPVTPSQPAPPAPKPPGHGGVPPGQAKKDKGKGKGEGD